MYFPILRGRQFELLAIRECVDKNIISNKIIPIIEPVKLSSTYIKTVNTFIEAGKSIAIVRNPQVGSWGKDAKKESNAKICEQAYEQFKNAHVISSFHVTFELDECVRLAKQDGIAIDRLLLLCTNPEYINNYEKTIGNFIPLYNVIPDKGDFRRRIRSNRVICEDHFPKQTRNVDYLKTEHAFFSSDHLYYQEDGYKGFSDYSVVGEEYNETGFAPYAVAIHIVYLNTDNVLEIAHFVSDSNNDISDPARKFEEAVCKLCQWNKTMKLDTIGIREFEQAFRDKTYPGLGMVKKYSIMHHLELMSRYLDGVAR